MCGIAGIFDCRDRSPIDRECLHRMTQSLAHRGPDGAGLHLEDGLGLGHRRLSIIDLTAGQQPMASANGEIILTFNGEIYNFRELRRELADQGAVFATHSDTEVILHAWRAWGEACVDRLNGMFAFALWDRPSQTLFMARDHLGIKPLYYSRLADGRLIFGSELKALLAHPDLPRRLFPPAVEDYFTFGYVPDPHTILAGVSKLAPGHWLRHRRGEAEPTIRRYWDVAFTGELDRPGPVADELIERLRHAVTQQMVSDVPLGAFLSGGVDSSAVVAMMAGVSDVPVTTCAIAFEQAQFDETRFAAQVAARYQTRHFVDSVGAGVADGLDRLCAIYDEPFADSSAMPTLEVCRLARSHVKVALSGDGGDEDFAGYRRHRWSAAEGRVRGLVPGALRRPLFGALGRSYPKMDWAPRVLRAKSTLRALALDTVEGYLESVAITTPMHRRALFSPAFARELGGYRSLDGFRRHAAGADAPDALSLVQYLDYKTYLPGDILTKVDRASMANGLEVRVPLLDHSFVEWAARISPHLKLSGREGKYIFKKALGPYLPHEVMYRPKMGFAVPLGRWLRGPLYDRVCEACAERLPETGCFDRKAMLTLVDQHRRGTMDHSAMLWALLMFDGFHRKIMGGADQAGVQAA